jgi:hypothetical protein
MTSTFGTSILDQHIPNTQKVVLTMNKRQRRKQAARRRFCRFEQLEERIVLAAAAFVWSGAAPNASQSWNHPMNWGGATSFPGSPWRTGSAGDTATFATAATAVIDTSSIAIASLSATEKFSQLDLFEYNLNLSGFVRVGATEAGTGRLEVTSSIFHLVPHWLSAPTIEVGATTFSPTGWSLFRATGANTYVNTTTIKVGGNVRGELEVKGGASVYTTDIDVGGDQPAGSSGKWGGVAVDGGGLLSVAGEMRLGTLANATAGTGGKGGLTVNLDGHVYASALSVGLTHPGEVTVNPGGLLETINTSIGVGDTGNLTATGGTVTVTGALHIGSATATGDVIINAGASLGVGGFNVETGRLWINAGTLNAAGSTVVAPGGQAVLGAGASVAINDTLQNSGVVTLAGIVGANLNGGLDNQGGLVEGVGQANVGIPLTNAGMVSPGFAVAGSEIGLLELTGTYTQEPNGLLAIQLASAGEHDVLAVDGSANLGGQLDVSLLNGFTPQLGEQFQIITGGVWGEFAGIPAGIQDPTTSPLPALDSNLRWDVSYSGGVTLTVVEAPTISIGDAYVDEAAGVMLLPVYLSTATSGTISVDYATANGSALAGNGYTANDYTSASGTLEFGPGETEKTIAVTIVDDNVDEDDEDFTIDLSNATSGITIDVSQATGTIYDDDAEPYLSIGGVTVGEEAGSAEFTVSLSAPSGKDISVDYYTWDNTATADDDYSSVSGTVLIAAGDTSATFSVTIASDTLDEDDETFYASLSNAINAWINDYDGMATITDDDEPPTVSINSAAGSESSGLIEFTVSLSAPSGKTISIDYATSADTATPGADYYDSSGSLTFYPGDPYELTQSVWVYIASDMLYEDYEETFYVDLSSPSNVTIAGGRGTGTILDSDDMPTVSIYDVSDSEGVGTLTFSVMLSLPSEKTITVNYSTTDGSAVAGSDFQSANGLLTFAPRETWLGISVSILDDSQYENTESFSVNLSSPTNATLDSYGAVGTGTIYDDDSYGGDPYGGYLTLDEPVYAGDDSPAATLDAKDLKPLLEEAIDRWDAAGGVAETLRERLNQYRVEVVDLPGSRLAAVVASTGQILIDINAAGYGWFIDVTPQSDLEFQRHAARTQRQAVGRSPALGRVDLLTVVMHELGHVLGMPELPVAEAPHDLMAGTLPLGTRRLPSSARNVSPLSLLAKDQQRLSAASPVAESSLQTAARDTAFAQLALAQSSPLHAETLDRRATRAPRTWLISDTFVPVLVDDLVPPAVKQ